MFAEREEHLTECSLPLSQIDGLTSTSLNANIGKYDVSATAYVLQIGEALLWPVEGVIPQVEMTDHSRNGVTTRELTP